MDLAPAIVTPELAEAALASHLFGDAIRLAEWIGDGKEVTSSGVLRPALAREACELLGIELPEGKVHSAGDIESLDTLWEIAQDAGLVTVSGKLAKAADLPADPDQILRSWLHLAMAPFGLPDEPCAECVTILAVLADASEPVSALALLEAVMSDFPTEDDDEDDDEDEDELSDENDEDELSDEIVDGLIGHASVTMFGLRDLNAISVTENDDPEKHMMLLTPLGQQLVSAVFTALTPAPGEMAGVVVRRFGELSPRIAAKISGPWLAGRTTADVAGELLDFAAYARADLRMVATAFVNTLGAGAAPAWRERVKDRGVGVYARVWLAEHGENVPMDGREQDWMGVEELSAHVGTMPEHLVLALFADLGEHEPDALPGLQRMLNRSRHPDAPKLIDAIGQVTGRPAVSARRDLPPVPSTVTGTEYRIRISLRKVENPGVWRTVAVDAGTTLADLHHIIQAAMGWSDDHLHSFGFGDDEVDEAAPLGILLRKPGDGIRYTYDIGDNWEHDIILETVDHNDSGGSLPALLDGAGACPPEDCGGVMSFFHLKQMMADPGNAEREEADGWLGASSFDPVKFSLADAAAAVSEVGSALFAERRTPTILRLQPRRKKRKR